MPVKYLITCLLLCCYFSAPAQHMYPSACDATNFCKDCGESKAIYKGNLTKYFEKEVNWLIIERLSGVIVVRVLVDTTGNACAYSFYNRSTIDAESINELKLDNIIKNMGKWIPATLEGKPVNASVMVAIYSRVQKHKIFEVNYLRNDSERKWTTNSTDAEGRKPVLNYDDVSNMNE